MDKEIKRITTMRMTKPEASMTSFPDELKTVRVFNLMPMSITLQMTFDGRMRSRKTGHLGRGIFSSMTADMSVNDAKNLIGLLEAAIDDV